MTTDELINRSIFIISEYYKNNLEPYFDSIGEDILWFGPSEGQCIQGKQNIIDTWTQEEHSLTFTMGDIKVQYVSPTSSVKEIMLEYDICTHYPSGNTHVHRQRLHYTWNQKRKKGPHGWETHAEIVMIHISNLWHYDSRDTIYPVHYEKMHEPVRMISKAERFVTIKASDRSVYRLLADHILYIETVKRSARLLVHTRSGTITINETLQDFEQRHPGLFLRIHASYLINPTSVREIQRFFVTLLDGTELPIPEKKYTKIKRLLLQDDD